MTPAPFNALSFARDLALLRENLEHASNEFLPIEHQDPASAALLLLIDHLTSGADTTTAVVKATETYNRIRGQQRAHEKAVQAQRDQEAAQLEADEEISRRVACPTCGAEASLSCVGTGRSGGIRKKSHADRMRLARSLNDGTPRNASAAGDLP
jgi:hypothetical protein